MRELLEVIAVLIGVAALIAGMVLLYRFVIPEKLNGTFKNKALQFCHDYFNFKKLYIESVLKFVFTLATVTCFAGGITGIFTALFDFITGLEYAFKSRYYTFSDHIGEFFTGVFASILFAVLGPIIIRLVYEGCMMFIMLVKNVIEINSKTVKPEDKIIVSEEEKKETIFIEKEETPVV